MTHARTRCVHCRSTTVDWAFEWKPFWQIPKNLCASHTYFLGDFTPQSANLPRSSVTAKRATERVFFSLARGGGGEGEERRAGCRHDLCTMASTRGRSTLFSITSQNVRLRVTLSAAGAFLMDGFFFFFWRANIVRTRPEIHCPCTVINCYVSLCIMYVPVKRRRIVQCGNRRARVGCWQFFFF